MQLILMRRASGLHYIAAVADDGTVRVWRPGHNRARGRGSARRSGHWSQPIPVHRRKDVTWISDPHVVSVHIRRMPLDVRPTIDPDNNPL